MKTYDKTIKADITIKVHTVTNAVKFMNMAKEQGATQIQDKETRDKGGRKYELNGEITYIYMV
ncbi:MAG: hypothetical protein NC110_00030 [Ruminococcus sp.]|nr:hypothetical protein [Ruminococcus sp.]